MPAKYANSENANANGGMHMGTGNMAFWLYLVGIAIIVLSHIWLLNKGTMVTADEIYYHSLTNLFAACLLIGGWWMRSSEEESLGIDNEVSALGSKLKHGAQQVKKTSTSWWDKFKGSEPAKKKKSIPYPEPRRRYDEADEAAAIRNFLNKSSASRMEGRGRGEYM